MRWFGFLLGPETCLLQAKASGDRLEVLRQGELEDLGRPRKSQLQKWYVIWLMFDVWFEGLPATFKPSARISSEVQRPLPNDQLLPAREHSDHPFR